MKNLRLIVLTAAVVLQTGAARGADSARLTEEQTRNYLTATTYKESILKPLLDRQRDGLRKIRTLIAADEPASKVQRELDALKEVFVAIQSVEARYAAALASFLTPPQIAKVAAARAAKFRKLASSAKTGDTHDAGSIPGDEEEKE